MIFSGLEFGLFFTVFLAIYALGRNQTQRATILLIASFIFYASWKPVYLILLLGSLSVNYAFYRKLATTRSRAWLILAITINLATLGAFKYVGLFLETFNKVAQSIGAIETAGPEWVNWALPLGISFYTFHMLSVMIDVYRGQWTNRISFLSWTLYVTYFPHMIAGPILRASELVEQLNRLGPITLHNLRLGGLIFVVGLIKKALLADNLAPLADKLYAQPEALDFYFAWVGTTAFALQIYFDFSGYSEMAIGLARMMGVSLPRNFLYPYISADIREFWQRWHITLSRWLRDYLYIGLGGSRCTFSRNMMNLMLTMLLGGLWHGAGWNFVFWGFLHGVYLVGHRLLLKLFDAVDLKKYRRVNAVVGWLGWPTTIILVNFTWVFFRATDFDDAWTICSAMLNLRFPQGEPIQLRLFEQAIIALGLLLTFLEPRLFNLVVRRDPVGIWWGIPFPLRGFAYAALALTLLVFGGQVQKFIYFDF